MYHLIPIFCISPLILIFSSFWTQRYFWYNILLHIESQITGIFPNCQKLRYDKLILIKPRSLEWDHWHFNIRLLYIMYYSCIQLSFSFKWKILMILSLKVFVLLVLKSNRKTRMIVWSVELSAGWKMSVIEVHWHHTILLRVVSKIQHFEVTLNKDISNVARWWNLVLISFQLVGS